MNLLLKEIKDKNRTYYEIIDKDTDTKIEKVTNLNFNINYSNGASLIIETLEGVEYNGPCHLQILPRKKDKKHESAN